jgi:hypothetical protein
MLALTKDGNFQMKNGKLLIIPEGQTPENCECCGPGCPWQKLCDGEYPRRVTDYFLNVEGISDSISGKYVHEACSNPGSTIGGGCASSFSFENLSFTLSGFSALNGRYNPIQGYFDFSGFVETDNDCTVCNFNSAVCQSWIFKKYVPVRGRYSGNFTFNFTFNGVPNTTTSFFDAELCGYATLSLSHDTKICRIGLVNLVYIPLDGNLVLGAAGLAARWGLVNPVVQSPPCGTNTFPFSFGGGFGVVCSDTGSILSPLNPNCEYCNNIEEHIRLQYSDVISASLSHSCGSENTTYTGEAITDYYCENNIIFPPPVIPCGVQDPNCGFSNNARTRTGMSAFTATLIKELE